jgi:hypothetical protein
MHRNDSWAFFEGMMKSSVHDVSKYLIVKGGIEQMIPEVADLWEEVPHDIRLIPGLTQRQKALIALTFAQARFWRVEHDRIRQVIAENGLALMVGNAEALKAFADGSFAGLGWSEAKKKTAMREVKRWSRGKGRRHVDSYYPWLKPAHEVPKLQTALGISDEGFRKAAARLGVNIAKSNSAKIAPGTVNREGTLKLLQARLQRRRAGDDKPAQRIWDCYAHGMAGHPGFSELRTILATHGATCE